MAQTIITLCDECLAGGSEVAGRTWDISMQAPDTKAAPYRIDACEMHAEPFQALLKMLGEYGSRADKRPPMPRVSTGGVSAPASPVTAPAGEHACPKCGHLFGSANGLRSHVKTAHGMGLKEAQGKAGIPCPYPDCERQMAAYQGLSVHLRTTHGLDQPEARAYVVQAREQVETGRG